MHLGEIHPRLFELASGIPVMDAHTRVNMPHQDADHVSRFSTLNSRLESLYTSVRRAMKHTIAIAVLCILAASVSAADPAAPVITTATVLEEMIDLGRLARWPDPAYRTIQFSSYDRRSTTSEAPGWFSNADGFGGEPIPAFLKVLRAPRDNAPGLYLLADVNGPGAIVRGWSAGMGGVLRVYLDPAEGSDGTMIWEGPAYDFLARRAAYYI